MKSLVLFVFCLIFSFHAFSQSYEQCINLVKENKYTEAIDGLENVKKSGDEKTSSLMLLSLIKMDQDHLVGSFDDFKKFYDRSQNPYPFFYAMSTLGSFNIKKNFVGDDIKKFLQKVIDGPNADMTISMLANSKLARFCADNGEFESARKLYDMVGEVKNWSVAGVFENVSGSGFNKEPGPLAHPESDFLFTNKIGLPVKWFDLSATRNDHWCDLSNYFNITNSIVYAQTFIISDSDREVLMKMGIGGSYKVWLNDFFIGAEREERNTDADMCIYRVHLQKGVNRLLLQIGSSENRRSKFIVRFSDPDNKLATNLRSESSYKPYKKADPYPVVTVPFVYEKYFEDYLAAHPDDIVSKILLLNIYNHNEKKYLAHKMLAILKNDAPRATMVSELALVTAVNDQNVVAESREKEAIKTNDPESSPAMAVKCDDAFNKERWNDAIDILKRETELYGTDVNTAFLMIRILAKKNDNEKLIAEVEKDYSSYPHSADIVYSKYSLILGGSKNLKVANDVLLKYMTNDYDERIMLQVIENEFKLGYKDVGKKLFAKLISNDPTNLDLYVKYANALYEMHDYTEAHEIIDRAIALAPYTGSSYYVKGLIYNAENKKDLAIEMLKKSIANSPTNYNVRKKLSELEGKKDLVDYFKDNDIQELYNNAAVSKSYGSDDLVCLLRDKRKIVYPEQGAVVEQDELLFLIKAQSAIDKMKEFDIPYNSFNQRLIINKVEVLKKDGSKVAAERHEGHCVFSSIETGDAVHVSYKLEDSYAGKLSEHFWDNFYFNNSYFPVKTARYSLVVPSSRKFNYKIINTNAEPVVQDLGDNYKLYVWEKNDLPKVKNEPAEAFDILEQLDISSIPDWNYVANWYSDITATKTNADYEVKEKVSELMAPSKGKSDVEKARIIYQYIEQNYHYSNVAFLHSAFTPQSATRTLNTKLGDCKDLASLFVSMAKEAGLNANLVLVATKGSDENQFELPTINFNHCIAELNSDNKNYFIELTNNYLPFSALNFSISNALGLIIPGGSLDATNTGLVKLITENKPKNLNVRTAELSFIDNQAIIHRLVIKTGSESASMRYYFQSDDEAERSKKLNEDVGKEFNKSIKMGKVAYTGLKSCGDTAMLEYKFTVDNFLSEIAGMKVFKMPWTETYPFTTLFSLEERTTPLDIWYLLAVPNSSEQITITLPPGKKLLEMPQDISLTCSALSYNIRYKMVKDNLVVTREMSYLKDRISPTEYPAVKAIVSKILEADGKQIAYK